jgi:hypothetical protein
MSVFIVSGLVNGAIVGLPDEANYLMQNHHGQYFWIDVRPTIVLKDHSQVPYDWTPRVKPIQYLNEEGFERVYQSEAPPADWTLTLQRVIRTAHLPKGPKIVP